MDYILENIGGELIELTDEQYQKTKVLEQKYLSDEWIQGKIQKFTFQNKSIFLLVILGSIF